MPFSNAKKKFFLFLIFRLIRIGYNRSKKKKWEIFDKAKLQRSNHLWSQIETIENNCK